MAKKQTAHRAGDNVSDAELAHTLRVAAQHIWLAGLGALARTQEESAKVFGALKSEGRHTSRSARQRLSEDVSRVTTQAVRGASGAIERLDQLFDARIGRTLRQLGVPTARDMQAIVDRLDELESHTGASTRKKVGGARTAARATGGKTVARKPGAKTAARAAAKKRSPTRTRA
ncbi:MAG TPA: phasin family protein [Burkholderiales bacterium]